MVHQVGITRFDDSLEATVFTLPGCRVGAATEDALHALLPLAIAEFECWLARHGEAVAPEAATEIVERITAAETDAADGEFTFAWDREPPSDHDLATALRWMAFAREDLLALTGSLPAAILDFRPPDSAMARIDPWKPHALTIREIIADIVGAECYYRSGVSDDPPSLAAGAPLDPARERDGTIAHLNGLSLEQRRHLYRVRREWQPEGAAEEWTVRKALRRIISHERFHTSDIDQRLAWLLLGVPGSSLDSRSKDRRS